LWKARIAWGFCGPAAAAALPSSAMADITARWAPARLVRAPPRVRDGLKTCWDRLFGLLRHAAARQRRSRRGDRTAGGGVCRPPHWRCGLGPRHLAARRPPPQCARAPPGPARLHGALPPPAERPHPGSALRPAALARIGAAGHPGLGHPPLTSRRLGWPAAAAVRAPKKTIGPAHGPDRTSRRGARSVGK